MIPRNGKRIWLPGDVKTEPEYGSMRGVVYRQQDVDSPWEPMHADDVPSWVKDPDMMAHLISNPGQAVSNPPDDRAWYRFEADKLQVH